MEINQKNTNRKCHGYWTWDNAWKTHYYNGTIVGYYETLNSDGSLRYKCHYINSKEIGCEQYCNSQYYYNKPDIKFGEKVIWE